MKKTKETPNFNVNVKNKNQIIATENIEIFSTTQAAKLLDIHPITLRNWEKKGVLIADHRTKGNHRRYTSSQLEPYIDAENKQRQLLTYPDTQTEELHPFKAQTKMINALIDFSSDKQTTLLMFLGMLIGILIKLVMLIRANNDLLLAATRVQEQYLKLQNDLQELQELQEINPQGYEKEKPVEVKGKKPKRSTIWQRSVASASDIFLKLTRKVNDQTIDDEERSRAKDLTEKTLEPYKRITKYIADFEPGNVFHDVAKLLLLKKPKDYDMKGTRWTVRDVSWVCKNELRTKSASKSQVGRVMKQLKWNSAIQPKLLSSDPNYGERIKRLGLVFSGLNEKDIVLFGDEFKYTSSKVAEYLKPKKRMAGLNISLPFSQHKPFYKTKAAIQLSGLLNGKTKDLLLKQVEDNSFDGYCKLLVQLLNKLISENADGKIYLIIDNAKNHSPKLLPNYLKHHFGEKVVVLFLPRYAPNHNPIERVWKTLLQATQRCGETEEELYKYLQDAVNIYDKNKSEDDLRLHCGVCSKKWIFRSENQKENQDSLNKHLCFQIDGLNPYVIYVLKNGLETLGTIHMGQEM